jgi:hypothetical protein
LVEFFQIENAVFALSCCRKCEIRLPVTRPAMEGDVDQAVFGSELLEIAFRSVFAVEVPAIYNLFDQLDSSAVPGMLLNFSPGSGRRLWGVPASVLAQANPRTS